jgi:hypothetical protein
VNQTIEDMAKTIVGSGGYDPADVNKNTDRLPVTMRELISKRLPETVQRFSPNMEVIKQPAGHRRKITLPINLSDLTRRRPKRPQAICQIDSGDLYQWQVLCRSLWNWCNGHNWRIDIDHRLNKKPEQWPLVQKFIRELGKIDGLTMDDLFGGVIWEEPYFVQAFLPLYNVECDEEYVPLVIFLEEYVLGHTSEFEEFTLPTAFWEACRDKGWDDEQTLKCQYVMKNILRTKRLRLLSEVWRKAILAVWAYQWPALCFYDYQQAAWDMNDADIDGLLECCSDILKLRTYVDPLVRHCVVKGSGEFWLELAERLDRAGCRHPELTKGKKERVRTTVQV